jgi:nickel superoxide dismutase
MLNYKNVKAHCDIPCGIYDPITAQIAALSVIRMIDLIHANEKIKSSDELTFYNNMARYIAVKESEAIKCKEEIRIIWGDFIKPPHVEQFPEIHTITHNIMAKGSAAKQHISREKALDLLNEVNKFAEIFWKIKGVKTKIAKSPYAPNEDVVYPSL